VRAVQGRQPLLGGTGEQATVHRQLVRVLAVDTVVTDQRPQPVLYRADRRVVGVRDVVRAGPRYALDALRPHFALWPRCALGARPAGVTLVAVDTLRAGRARVALLTRGTGRAGVALGALRAGSAVLAVEAGQTLQTHGTHRAHVALRALRAGHAGVALVAL